MAKQVKICRNPRCLKNRETLDLLKESGVESEVVFYLETPADAATLHDLLRMPRVGSARELMRQKENFYKELNPADNSFSEKALIQAMVGNLKLMEHPIVVADGKARISRPPEQVLEIVGQDVLYRQLEYIVGCDVCHVLSGLRILWTSFVQFG